MKTPETLSSVFDSEISNQIKLAKSNPRVLKECLKEIEFLSQMNLETALSFFYTIFDKDKPLIGVSVSFAEIIVSSWGNVRAGARIVSKTDKMINIQGYIYDLEKNIFMSTEVLEPLTDKNGKPFKNDLITARINAASSIAFRNAVFKAIPSAIFSVTIKNIKDFIMKSLDKNLVNVAIEFFNKYNISEKQLVDKLKIPTFDNITQEKLFILHGMINAIQEGDTSIENLFNQTKHKTKFERAFDLAEETVVVVPKKGRPPKKATVA